jgi:hypothetical protein
MKTSQNVMIYFQHLALFKFLKINNLFIQLINN